MLLDGDDNCVAPEDCPATDSREVPAAGHVERDPLERTSSTSLRGSTPSSSDKEQSFNVGKAAAQIIIGEAATNNEYPACTSFNGDEDACMDYTGSNYSPGHTCCFYDEYQGTCNPA